MVGEGRLISAALALTVALTAVAAFGQEVDEELIPPRPPEPRAEGPSLEALWRDMIHYIRIAQVDAARSTVEAILEMEVDPPRLFQLSVETPQTMTVLTRASRMSPEMKKAVDQLRERIKAGYRADVTDPERIKRSIDMLVKGLEGLKVGGNNLRFHGEYAVAQLRQTLMDPNTTNELRTRVTSVLPRLGKDAVRPLSVALQTEDSKLRKIITESLGHIGYPHALPRLKELADREDVEEATRKALVSALRACGGKGIENLSTAMLYYQLAEKYYYRAESLLPDSRFEKANVWFWRERLGLLATQVPREIFCDHYTMRMSRLALMHDPNFHAAVSLWISADLNREANLPAGQSDPLRPARQPPPKFYALASSPRYLLDVVERALKDYNTPVAMGAIRALVRTAGSKSLLGHAGSGARPLVEAMSYPDREVRFYAAVSLARSLPGEPFEGSGRVMAVLNSALRQRGRKVAMLICADLTQRNKLKGILREEGYVVIDAGDAKHAIAAATRVSGVDVTVLGPKPDAPPVVEAVRRMPIYARMPFVLVQKTQAVRLLADRDKSVWMVDPALEDEELTKELKEAVAAGIKRGVGRALTDVEATNWSVTAAKAIRRLGETGNKVINISLAEKVLVTSLDDTRQPVQIAAARALAVMDTSRAQRSIANLAINPEADTALRLAIFGALGESVRRFGNQLLGAHVKGIIETVTNEDEDMSLREAAAELLGSLNLPSRDVIPLIKSAGE
ncbi:MAG: HEAT repeat domain-containing protein [Planctomycetota bacterium]|jgi:HEAT repeat protein